MTKKGSSTATAGASKDAATSKSTGAAADAAGNKGPQCDWVRSTFSKRDENKARRMGLIPEDEASVRSPGADARPNPPAGFRIMFVSFLYRGLSLPAHEFLRCLLFTYGIQLWQLTPNSILHLALFITLCECYLGVEPHFALWKKIFFVKRHGNNDGQFVVGGVGFAVRPGIKYFGFPMRESVQNWRKKWFYIKDQKTSEHLYGLKEFSDVLEAQPKKTWRNILTADEKVVADKLYAKVLELKNTGGQEMLGTEIAADFLRRRIQPIQARPHPMWRYKGTKDLSKIRTGVLTDEALLAALRPLTSFNKEDKIPIVSPKTAFDAKHPPTEVRCRLFSLLLMKLRCPTFSNHRDTLF